MKILNPLGNKTRLGHNSLFLSIRKMLSMHIGLMYNNWRLYSLRKVCHFLTSCWLKPACVSTFINLTGHVGISSELNIPFLPEDHGTHTYTQSCLLFWARLLYWFFCVEVSVARWKFIHCSLCFEQRLLMSIFPWCLDNIPSQLWIEREREKKQSLSV